ncbi:MAG: hypothetical protein ABIH18_00805 [Candidatus Omnitrophota bacterium]
MEEMKKNNSLIRLASIMLFVIAGICLLGAGIVLIPGAVENKAEEGIALFWGFALGGILYCLMGWGLRKLYKWAGFLVIAVSAVNIISNLLILRGNPISLIGIIINTAIGFLVIRDWEVLK